MDSNEVQNNNVQESENKEVNNNQVLMQEIRPIEDIDLLNAVQNMKNKGYRLAQICATKLEQFVLLYSFVKEGEKMVSLQVLVDYDQEVESIDWLYSYAFLYENEMKDLFGVKIINLGLDFNGHLYKTSIKTPFGPEDKKEDK